MKKRASVRQGDVMLTPIQEPKDKRLVAQNRIVLAEGETTGHAHVIEDVGVAEFVTDAGERVVWVESPTTISHEEHTFTTPDVLQRGWYAVVEQVEEDPLAGIRRVAD